MSTIDAIYDAFNGRSDEEWLRILLQSISERIVEGVEMPSFPDSETQIAIQGGANEAAVKHAFSFFKEVAAYAAFCGRPLIKGRMLLDFGCGWGRITRLFQRDLDPRDIYAVDPEGVNIDIARRCNSSVNFIASRFLPPFNFDDKVFDYITAFSVFSHLDEYASKRWFEEFHRILKPGGIVVFTTMPRSFLGFTESLREKIAALEESGSGSEAQVHRSVASSFPDIAVAEQQYDDGQFLYSPSMGLPPSPHARWGWSIISKSYIEKNWSRLFHLVDFVEDSSRMDQVIVVLQKPFTKIRE